MLLQATGFLVPVCLNGAYFLFKHHSFISIVFFLFEKICKKHHCRDQYPSCHRYNRSCIAGFCCFSRFFVPIAGFFWSADGLPLPVVCPAPFELSGVDGLPGATGSGSTGFGSTGFGSTGFSAFCFSTSVSVAVATSVCLSSFFVSLPSKRSFAAANALSKSDVSL